MSAAPSSDPNSSRSPAEEPTPSAAAPAGNGSRSDDIESAQDPVSTQQAAGEAPELPQNFRFNGITYFTVPMALLVTVILAGANPTWLGWTLILPVLLAVWIARVKTVVTADGLRAVGTFGTTEMAWPDIAGLKFTRWGPARAVLTSGKAVRLPAITFNDMPRLSAASGGRIPDPLAPAKDAQ